MIKTSILLVALSSSCFAGDLELVVSKFNRTPKDHKEVFQIKKGPEVGTINGPRATASGELGGYFKVEVRGANSDILGHISTSNSDTSNDDVEVGIYIQIVRTASLITDACADPNGNVANCNAEEVQRAEIYEANIITVADIRSQNGGVENEPLAFYPASGLDQGENFTDGSILKISGLGCWALAMHEGYFVSSASSNYEHLKDYITRNSTVGESSDTSDDQEENSKSDTTINSDVNSAFPTIDVGIFEYAGFIDEDGDRIEDSPPAESQANVDPGVNSSTSLDDLMGNIADDDIASMEPNQPTTGPTSTHSMPPISHWAFAQWDLCGGFTTHPKARTWGTGSGGGVGTSPGIREDLRCDPPFAPWSGGSTSPPPEAPEPNSGGEEWEKTTRRLRNDS